MFGEIMRGHRARLGLTQEELAERTGISVRGIRNLEAGRINAPRAGALRVLADAFGLQGVERDRLFTFTFVEQRPDGLSAVHATVTPGLDTQPSPLDGDGWHVARFSVLVRLDTPGVGTYQDWRIIADRDGLDQITPGVSIPLSATAVSGPGLEVEVRYGARLLRHEQPLPYRSQFTLVLPRSLQVRRLLIYVMYLRSSGMRACPGLGPPDLA